MRAFALILGLVGAAPTQKPAESPTSRRELLSWSRLNCYVDADGKRKDVNFDPACTDLPSESSACTVSSTGLCQLNGLNDDSSNFNGVDANRWEDNYVMDHCSKSIWYYQDSSTPGADATITYFCEQLDSLGDWSSRKRPSNRRERTGDSSWSCWWKWGYEYHNGNCRDSTRFLGEECWDDSGECYNSGVDSYDPLHISCATEPELGIDSPTCLPSAFKLGQQTQCTCNWFDWHIGFACGASQCNGHPCVWSTGNGLYWCDYQANNNW